MKAYTLFSYLFIILLSCWLFTTPSHLLRDEKDSSSATGLIPINSSSESNGVKKILVDISHGFEGFIPAKASTMGGLLESTGDYEVISTLMKQAINEADLIGVDIFVVMFPDPTFPYSGDEIQIINDFWKGGGSILFVGALTYGESARSNNELNRIISALDFNLSFSNIAEFSNTATDSPPSHELMHNMNSFRIRGAPIYINDQTNIEILTRGSNDKANLVTFENETHRSVFLASTSPLLEYRVFEDDGYRDNHYQFQYNLMNWLSFSPAKVLSDYLPIRVYSGISSPHNIDEIKSLPFYKGMCHFHTAVSNVDAPYAEVANVLGPNGLDHDFAIVTDYNDVSGGPALRDYLSGVNDVTVIDGVETTGLGQYHVVGWFEPNNATDIEALKDPISRINLYHDQNSPAFLAHPSWLISPDYPRIWDHDLYPFDGYEVINSGFLGGDGHLAKFPFYGATDSHSANMFELDGMGMVWNYVFTENISESPDWWTEAVYGRQLVIYSALGDFYFGDQLLVDEIVGRLNDEHPPEISVISPTSITPNTDVTLSAVITDASRVFSVNLSVKVNEASPEIYTLEAAAEDYSSYTKDLGSFNEGDSVVIILTAADELGYSAEKVVEVLVESPTTSETSSQTTTTQETDGPASWLSLPIFLAGISTLVIIMRKWRINL